MINKGYTKSALRAMKKMGKGCRVSWAELRDTVPRAPTGALGSIIRRSVLTGVLTKLSKGNYEIAVDDPKAAFYHQSNGAVNGHQVTQATEAPAFTVVPYRNDGTVLIITPRRTFIAQEVTLQKVERRNG